MHWPNADKNKSAVTADLFIVDITRPKQTGEEVLFEAQYHVSPHSICDCPKHSKVSAVIVVLSGLTDCTCFAVQLNGCRYLYLSINIYFRFLFYYCM